MLKMVYATICYSSVETYKCPLKEDISVSSDSLSSLKGLKV